MDHILNRHEDKNNTLNKKPIINTSFADLDLTFLDKYEIILFVEGYPRQATTFLKTLLSKTYTQEEVAVTGRTHIPRYFDLYQKNLYFILPIRNPVDAITSWLVKNGFFKSLKNYGVSNATINFANKIIDDYILFYEKVLNSNNKEQFIIFKFEDVISNSKFIIEKIFNTINIEPENENFLQVDLVKEIEYQYKYTIENQKDHWKKHGYVPREDKVEHDFIKKIILSSIFSEKINICNNIYDILLEMEEAK